MDSFQETTRQIRIALVAIGFVVTIGVVGLMAIEGVSLLDAVWITITTLGTIGYGDIVARTVPGRIFTIFLILIGLSVFAFGIQAGATFLVSPAIRDLRLRRRIQHRIDQLERHYIICGRGELVNKTITYLQQRAQKRRALQYEQFYQPIDALLDGILGDDAHGHYPRLRRLLARVAYLVARTFHGRSQTLLDVVVVVTNDPAYANELRSSNLLVVEGEPTSDGALKLAGVQRAYAMMAMLDSDVESLMTVLTARSYNPNIYITAATLEEGLSEKMIRVGANSVIAPFDVAGQFLNNATLRPAVNDFFNSILFSQDIEIQTTQLLVGEGSPWIGKHLGRLQLRERFEAAIIGLRTGDGNYLYAPGEDYILRRSDVLIAVAPARYVEALQNDCQSARSSSADMAGWASFSTLTMGYQSETPKTYSLIEAERAIQDMSNHFIVCGTGRVARNAINKLNPERPFVIISDDGTYTSELLRRGFRVVNGNPTQEDILRKAGVDRALAIMVAIDDKADNVLTVLICRSLSERLLITTTAVDEEMIGKLRRAGADRVVSPFHIAAELVLLATTRPVATDFFQYVLFNYHAGIETTELYMQNDSPWIGSTIESLRLDRLFRAGVIGIRLANGQYIYAPPVTHVLKEYEVMIVVTPMVHSDELRLTAHGSVTKRPYTLRQVLRTMANPA